MCTNLSFTEVKNLFDLTFSKLWFFNLLLNTSSLNKIEVPKDVSIKAK